jgi:hypothetical protein
MPSSKSDFDHDLALHGVETLKYGNPVADLHQRDFAPQSAPAG